MIILQACNTYFIFKWFTWTQKPDRGSVYKGIVVCIVYSYNTNFTLVPRTLGVG